MLAAEIDPQGRIRRGDSVLFPNLYPYGAYSAVSLFDHRHFVEIGTAAGQSYADCFVNCAAYLEKVLAFDSEALYAAITQNHLPSAGGSLIHPHLQVQADRVPSNRHELLGRRSAEHYRRNGSLLLSDCLAAERSDGRRMIGTTGPWHWLAAFAPQGFFEIWAVLPEVISLRALDASLWGYLADGVVNVQKFYRSLCRNSYNLGLLAIEGGESRLELRAVFVVRSNYAPWVRNDITGYEMMLGDMATFSAPEEVAVLARPFWS
jgi:galactose-1-phosphate uridylyltransferase